MRPVSLTMSPDTRRRTISIVLTIIIHALLLLLLLRLAPEVFEKGKDQGSLSTFNVSPDGQNNTPRKSQATTAKKAGGKEAPKAAAQPKQPMAPENPSKITLPEGFITMSRSDFSSTDVGKMASKTGNGTDGNSASKGDADGDGAEVAGGGGTGPDTLYNADWARRPTSAELSFYMPKGRQVFGWGMIACKTVPGNRVEDCREIGQSPPGSGLSRAVREAAWQFRVLPPRVGNKPTVGAWVRIRIDYTEGGAKLRD